MARSTSTYRAHRRNRFRGTRPPCAICGGASKATCSHTRSERDRAADIKRREIRERLDRQTAAS